MEFTLPITVRNAKRIFDSDVFKIAFDCEVIDYAGDSVTDTIKTYFRALLPVEAKKKRWLFLHRD